MLQNISYADALGGDQRFGDIGRLPQRSHLVRTKPYGRFFWLPRPNLETFLAIKFGRVRMSLNIQRR